MSRGLLLGQDAAVAAWAFATHNRRPMAVDSAIGVVEDNRLVGAVLFQNYNGNNVDVSYYGRGRALTAGLVRSFARAALAYDPSRATIMTSRRNKHLVRALVRMGWSVEGGQRRFYGARDSDKHAALRLVLFRPGIDALARLTPPTASDAKATS